jgi:uncharacterized OsmC-like protein
MDAHALRALQAPLKDRYRADPNAAVITLKAHGTLDDQAIACAGVTLKAVATALEIDLRRGTVSAEGDLDFRGTLGVDKTAPVGFRAIRLSFDIDADAPQDKIDQLLKLTERYCVVFQTLNTKPELSATLRRA